MQTDTYIFSVTTQMQTRIRTDEQKKATKEMTGTVHIISLQAFYTT